MSIIDGGDAFSTYGTSTAGYAPATRLVSEVFRAVKRQFGDESGVQLEDADIIGWINDAQEEIVKRNRALKTRSVTSSIAGQAEYSFPNDDIIQVESIHYDGALLRNLSFPVAQATIIDKATVTDTGAPELWYEWGGNFTIWPTPSDSLPIELYYTALPTPVVLSTDTLTVPDKYYLDVVRYALQQAYELDEDWAAAQAKAKQFSESLTMFGEEERTAQHMTYPTITVYLD